jgi:hypothetical protein
MGRIGRGKRKYILFYYKKNGRAQLKLTKRCRAAKGKAAPLTILFGWLRNPRF